MNKRFLDGLLREIHCYQKDCRKSLRGMLRMIKILLHIIIIENKMMNRMNPTKKRYQKNLKQKMGGKIQKILILRNRMQKLMRKRTLRAPLMMVNIMIIQVIG